MFGRLVAELGGNSHRQHDLEHPVSHTAAAGIQANFHLRAILFEKNFRCIRHFYRQVAHIKFFNPENRRFLSGGVLFVVFHVTLS